MSNQQIWHLPAGPVPAVDDHEDHCIQQALQVLEKRVRRGAHMGDSRTVKNFVRLRLAPREYEVFAVLWLDGGKHMLEFNEMFRGTLSQSSVYPREVVREAMRLNAACCILAHNHPSGSCEPSEHDKRLTRTLETALALVGVIVIDHIIVAAGGALSMAEHELM